MSCSSQNHHSVCEEGSLDRSLQKPLSLLFGFSVVWLLVATLLSAIAFWQIKFPGTIDFQKGIQSSSWGWLFSLIHEALNYGRAVSASKSVLFYGWLLQAALGVCVWVSTRLTKQPFCCAGGIFVLGGIVLWNAAVFFGLVGILSGESTGLLGFDFPKHAALILFAAYTLIAIGVAMKFALKKSEKSSISEWYIIGAVFWFPWFFMVASYFIHFRGVLGVMQPLVHAWYLGGLQVLVLGGLSIASLYYLVPFLLNAPLNRCHTAKNAFWFFAFLGAWSGVRYLVGGPLPAWIVSSGVVAGGLLLIPGTVIANNQMIPLWANWNKVRENPVLWYLAVGGVSFMVWLGLEALISFRTIGSALRFSYMEMGIKAVFEYSFVSMVLFGAIYAILPLITGKDLKCCVKCCMKRQFWWGFCGLITFFTGAFLAGAFMGLGTNFAPMAFLAVKNIANPFFWLIATGGFMIVLSNLIFVKNVVVTLVSACCDSNKEGCCS